MRFLAIPISIAALDWLALWAGWMKVDRLAKPATMVALLAWTWLSAGLETPSAALSWLRIGLLFSLLGDIFFLPEINRFLPGLLAFLLGHLAYIAALNPGPPPLNAQSGLVALVLIGLAGRFARRLQQGIKEGGQEKLRLPVMVYTAVITLMLISAWLTPLRPDWPGPAVGAVAAGATLFVISDGLLAWNRFVTPFPQARLRVRIPYHLGQIGLALGIALAR